MKKMNQTYLITCILPLGKGLPLLEMLVARGATTTHFAHARGSDLHGLTATSEKLLNEEQEKEIVSWVAFSQAEADEFFQVAFESANMNHPGGGMMYMHPLDMSTPFEVMIQA
jgi:hypothetical protein